MGDHLKITRRNLPHWHLPGSVYYVTFRVAQAALCQSERNVVLEHIKHGDKRFYELVSAVVMPDHTHLILRPRESIDLSRIMKGIKGVSARLVNELRGTVGQLWQDESWDRILRDQSELDEKLRYMLNNPVDAGLVADGWEYDAWYYNAEAL